MRVTRNGKVLYNRPGRRHLLSGKSAKRRRQLRRRIVAAPGDARRARRMLGLQ